jgi:cyclophilin family peptidyl-prolyl cis-trans isomerase
MITRNLKAALLTGFLLGAGSPVPAQAPPATLQKPKPHLKRDRTQRVLVPKIVEAEDERLVTDQLIDLVTVPHGSVRRRAVVALGRIGSPRGIAPLVTVLSADKDPQMRALAAFALGEIESHYSVEPLIEQLQNRSTDTAVRARIVEALGKIAANRESAAALGAYATNAIALLVAGSLPDSSRDLTEDEKLLGSLALTALLRLKKPDTIKAIAAQLRSRDPELRWQAANALARIGQGIAPAVPDLLTLLESGDALGRAYAARALAASKEKRATGSLIRLLGDPDSRVAANAISALGAIGDASAVEPLTLLGNRLLDEYRRYDRKANGYPTQQNLLFLIATSLGNIGDTRALPFLKSLRLADGKLGISPEVEMAVAKFGQDAFSDTGGIKLSKDDWRAMQAYAQGLGALRTDRSKFLLLDLLAGRIAGKPDPRAVPDILRALAAAKAETLRDILLEQLQESDVYIRAAAAELIGEMGDSSRAIAGGLEAALKAARTDKANDARIAIIEAAAKLKQPLASQLLSGPTRDEDYVVRKRAAELIREAGREENSLIIQVGTVKSGHDRAYWRRIALMATSQKNPVAVLKLKKGEIRIELFATDAPMTVDNFIELARRGFYNGLSFMRVVPNFVIQGGDPRGDMNGGPDYQIRCEINLRRYGAGAVGMALSGKDTGGSQFFITHSPQPHLDGGYTVFGQVISGMDVVERIARDDRVESVQIIGN